MIVPLAVWLAAAMCAWADVTSSSAEGKSALATGPLPNLVWPRSPGAGWPYTRAYEIEISAQPDFSSVLLRDRTEIERYVPTKESLEGGKTYWWRVRLTDGKPAADWSAPGSFTVTDFARHVVVLKDGATAADARRAFAEARTHAPMTIRLAADMRWAADENDILPLTGLRDVLFDGAGHRIVITNPANCLFQIKDCRNLVFRDFEVDYDPLPYALCEVTAVMPQDNEIEVRVIRDAANPCLELDDPRMLAADRKHVRILDRAHPGRVKPGEATFIHDTKQEHRRRVLRDGAVHHVLGFKPKDYNVARLAAGDYLLRIARWDSRNIFRALGTSDLCLQRVVVYAGPSQFVSCIDGSGLVLADCHVKLKPGRYGSIDADCVYGRRNSLGPWIEGCSFAANGDDCINLHSLAIEARYTRDGSLVPLSPGLLARFDAGDEIVVWNGGLDDPAPYVSRVTARKDALKTLEFLHDGSLPYPADSRVFVYDIAKSNQRFYLARNRIVDCARIGLLLSSAEGVVRNNRFDGCAASAVQVGNNPREGLITRDVLLADNVMTACGYCENYFAREAAVVAVNSFADGWKPVPHRFHRRLKLVNTTFEDWNSDLISLAGCEEVTIAGTRVGRHAPAAGSDDAARCSILTVGNCSDVQMTGTRVDDPWQQGRVYRDAGGTGRIKVERFGPAGAPARKAASAADAN